MSYCLTASCLAHRGEVFWNPYFRAWVHLSCAPCEALAGEPDPTLLTCVYCVQRTEIDGAGHLWTHVPDAPGHWEEVPAPERWRWHDDKWTDRCRAAPSGLHEPLVLTGSQADG